MQHPPAENAPAQAPVPLFVKTFRSAMKDLPTGGTREDLPLGRVLVGCLATVVLLALIPSVGVGLAILALCV